MGQKGEMRIKALAASVLLMCPNHVWADDYVDTQCRRVLEGNVMVDNGIQIPPAYLLKPFMEAEGFVVEDYFYFWKQAKTELKEENPPLFPELAEFFGVRVVDCSSGKFVAIPTYADSSEVSSALYGTEFIRKKLKAGRKVSFADIAEASGAAFNDTLVLQESAETCSCNKEYPRLRPASLLPYVDRTDIKSDQ
jgi:hypothetical protein